jgi:transcriptional regulator with XRE-family HTH domain
MAEDRHVAVTIKDIAARAGFLHATVSPVLNGRAAECRISSGTAETAEHAVRALRYFLNRAARGFLARPLTCAALSFDALYSEAASLLLGPFSGPRRQWINCATSRAMLAARFHPY